MTVISPSARLWGRGTIRSSHLERFLGEKNIPPADVINSEYGQERDKRKGKQRLETKRKGKKKKKKKREKKGGGGGVNQLQKRSEKSTAEC